MNNHQTMQENLAVYGQLDDDTRRRVDAHLQTCPACRAQLRLYREMDRRLHDLSDPRPDPDLRPNFYAALDRAQSPSPMTHFRRLPALALRLLFLVLLAGLGWSVWNALQTPPDTAVAPVTITRPPRATTPPTVLPDPQPVFNVTGHELKQPAYAPGDTLTVHIKWGGFYPTGHEIMVLELQNERGEIVAEERHPLNQPPDRLGEVLVGLDAGLDLPADLPGGEYQLILAFQTTPGREPVPFTYEGADHNGRVTLQTVPIHPDRAAALPPIIEAAGVQIESWSPDGTILAFREFSQADYAAEPQNPAGQLRIYDIEAGRFCFDSLDERDGDDWFTWVNDRTFVYLADGGHVVMRRPCDDLVSEVSVSLDAQTIVAQSGDADTLLLRTADGYLLHQPRFGQSQPVAALNAVFSDGRFSPDDAHIALFNHEGDIALIRAEDGALVRGEKWQTDNLGDAPPPIWLDDETVLVRGTAVDPQRLSLSGDPQPLADQIGLPIDPAQTRVAAARHPGGGYTIALYDVGDESQLAPIRLYHSSSGETETLTYTRLWGDGFSPDGRYLLLLDTPTEPDGTETYQFLTRPAGAAAAAADAAPATLFQSSLFPTPTWSRSGDRITFQPISDRLLAYTFPGKTIIGEWSDAEHRYPTVTAVRWSPDGRHLAFTTGLSGRRQAALFIVTPEP